MTWRSTFSLILLASALAARPAISGDMARVEIRVTTPSATPWPSAYVAVVAEDARWAEPTHEAILGSTGRVEWQIAPGRYRVVAGAPGAALEYGSAFELHAGESTAQRYFLPPLVPVKGRVTTTEGQPVEGAKVGDLRAFLPEFTLQLSPLGESHLASNFSGLSGRDGSFSLSLHPTGGQFLYLEAKGYQPRFWANVHAAQAREVLGEIHLEPGASLSVRTSGRAGTVPYDRLLLLPAAGGSADEIPRGAAQALWSRNLGGELQEWRSLPPGEVTLWAKGPPGGAHTTLPRLLERLVLRAAEHLEVPLVLPSEVAARPDPERPLSLFVRDLSAEELEGIQADAWLRGVKENLAVQVMGVSGGARLHLPVGCRQGASVGLVHTKWVGWIERVEVDACELRASLVLHRRGSVRVTLRPPPGQPLPSVARLRFDACSAVASGPRQPQFSLLTKIGPDGRLEAAAPAGCSALRIEVDDYAPLVLAARAVEPDKTLDLGRRSLRYGSALLVRLISAADGRGLAGASIKVVAADALGDAARGVSTDWPEGSGQSALTDETGWARLYGLPVGEVAVFARRAQGRLAQLVARAELEPREERVLDDLVLPLEARLCVVLEAREDGAGAKPVEVVAQGGDPRDWTGQVLLSAAVVGGREACFLEIPAGRWRLSGLALGHGGKKYPAGTSEVEIAPGEDKSVSLALSDLLFRGKVSYLGRAVRGSLTLLPSPIDGRRKMTTRLSGDGEFLVPLERAGRYRAEVWDEAGQLAPGLVESVWFGDPERDVEIEVPGGSISGSVIGEDGQAVPGAKVLAELRDTEGYDEGAPQRLRRSLLSGESGAFALEGMPPGLWLLRAERGGAQSRDAALQLHAEERVQGLRLELREKLGFRGWVQTLGGQRLADVEGVAGLALEVPGGGLRSQRWRSGSDGEFTLETAGQAPTAVNLQLVLPGGLACAARLALVEPLVFAVPEAGGRVVFELPASYSVGTNASRHWLVAEDGAFLSLRAATRVVPRDDSPGEVVLFGEIAPGSWSLVRAVDWQAEGILAAGLGRSLPSLATFVVVPGSELVVSAATDPSRE